MEKPIIATALKGILIDEKAWDNAHELWFEERSKELNDESIKEWIGKENYFQGVDEVMEKLFPELNDEQRTVKARELYFDSVIKYIENNSVRKEETIEFLNRLRDKYSIALITSNVQVALDKILLASDLMDFFDIVEPSLLEEKDDKHAIFDRFLEFHGKPAAYLGTNKDSLEYAKELEIKTVSSVEELKEVI